MEKGNLKVGDCVWAKLGNWPWWPSKVRNYHKVIQIDIGEKKPIIVRFFGWDENNDL